LFHGDGIGQRVWNTAKDLKLIKPAGYEELAPRATELKRMLTAEG